ncbi:hypothetical protein FRACYDRAFT_246923 [Fragilariopsis cylindrus CCMP1102]|uniref:Uncharacterized protein n=1 Tax=Fragilariopsis cylindrus CCMP1102 TaxID=635003 RepID=A0A1E7EXA1_9STRA|nr:hypothetical protein FRACYDRAFT_246923 [Fragilariopsis cylindrus CCMP1102]|eukprot:OEU10477.1 hypothetical protein FRACYDRAFT_246923 [Fragilariopsis cylindrus CCMP1102]
MAATTTTTTTTTKTILSKVDPFILDGTIRNLDKLLGSSGSSGLLLPLKASNTTNGSGNSNDDTSDRRQYLETFFNKLDGGNKYRNPFVIKNNNNEDEDEEIFKLESSANEVWDAYRQLYYGHDNSIGSVYFRRKGSGSDSSSGGESSPSSGTTTGTGSGGGLEAFFGIQKKCFTTDENKNDDENSSSTNNAGGEGEKGDENEFARWESVHYITIQEPNYDNNTCEYKINSTIWCRFQPEDVGDIPPLLKQKQKQKKTAAPVIKKVPPAAAKPKSPTFKGLERARLEIFDKAKDNWDSRHNKKVDEEEEKKKKIAALQPRTPINSSPIPAVVTSSSYHEEETIKVIPIASHIHNIGTEIEKLESNYRKRLEMIHISKTCEILQGMYSGGGGSNGTTSQTQTQARPAGLHKHATGMGVGASLIGEIALKAKLKGLGNSCNGDGGSPSDNNDNNDSSTGGTGTGGTESKDTNKAMESILAAEKKKKLSQEDNTNAADTKINDWKSNLKKTTSTNTNTAPPPTGTTTATSANTTNDWKSGLKKTTTTTASSKATTTTSNNENNSTTTYLQASLKKTTKPSTATSTATKTATPEFLDFRKCMPLRTNSFHVYRSSSNEYCTLGSKLLAASRPP